MTQNAPQTEAAEAARRAAWRKQAAARQAKLEGDARMAAAVRPPAGPAMLRSRHRVALASLVAAVLLPTLAAIVYLYVFAVDQYASKVGFSVRKEESSSAVELLGGLSAISGSSWSDTDILYEYLQSQELVRTVDETFDLREIYSRPAGDRSSPSTPTARSRIWSITGGGWSPSATIPGPG